MCCGLLCCFFFFQAEDGIRDLVRSRGLGDVYKRQGLGHVFFGDKMWNGYDARLVDSLGAAKNGIEKTRNSICLLYTSDAADERSSVDLGGRRIIKKKKCNETRSTRQY